MEKFRFQVNLGGMIQILSEHLYSSPDVYIRELLQNGTDAITARQKKEPEFSEGEIQITIQEKQSLIFTDNGIGLTEQEIHQFLAVIGETSKKTITEQGIPSDYIGRFGIGLLSCFMVSDEIRIRTHSATEEAAYEWVGKQDGTYTIQTITEPFPIGTSVYLTKKEGKEDYFTKEIIIHLIHYYGMLLPFPIFIDDGIQRQRINAVHLPWESRVPKKEELLFFGQLLFRENFFDCILLHSESGKVTGVAYILPYKVQPSVKQNHRIYLKNMLLTEQGDRLLPKWAFFVKCIINAFDLRPTASREGFYEDELLEQAKKEIGACIIDYLRDLAQNQEEQFQRFFQIHHLAIKSLAVEQDDLYQFFIDYVEFQTTRGTKSGYELRTCGEPLIYTNHLDKFKQLSQIFFARGKLLINTGYVYDQELLLRMEEFFSVEVIEAKEEEIELLMNDLSMEEEEKAGDFVRKAGKIMKRFHCEAELKQFQPSTLPVFYYVDENARMYRDIIDSKEKSSALFYHMLSSFANEIRQKADSILYFNYQNPIIQKMTGMQEGESFQSFVEILYVQALLIGGFPLHNDELALMNQRLLTLMERGMFDV